MRAAGEWRDRGSLSYRLGFGFADSVGVTGSGVPRTTMRQITRNTPSVRNRWTQPGAVVVNVIHAQPASIVTPATVSKSMGCRGAGRVCAATCALCTINTR